MRKLLKKILRCWAAILALGKNRRRPTMPSRILVIAAGYLGDTFWATAAIRELLAAYPQAEIYVLTRRALGENLLFGVIAPTQILNGEAILRDCTREKFSLREFLKTVRRVRALNATLVVDLMNNRYSAILAWLTGKFTVGAADADEFGALYSFIGLAQKLLPQPLAQRPCILVRQFLQITPQDDFAFSPPLPRFSPREMREKLNLPENANIALLVVGAGWAAKQWAAENFHAVAQWLAREKFYLFAVGAANEKHLCAAAIAALPQAQVIVDDLAMIFSLLPLCKIALGGDTGLMHLAAANGVKCLTLYCPTNPAFIAASGTHTHFLRAACAHRAPTALHCQTPPLLQCSRAECMQISPNAVIAEIEKRLICAH